MLELGKDVTDTLVLVLGGGCGVLVVVASLVDARGAGMASLDWTASSCWTGLAGRPYLAVRPVLAGLTVLNCTGRTSRTGGAAVLGDDSTQPLPYCT